MTSLRALLAALVAATLPLAGAARAECPWTGFKTAPSVTTDDGVIKFAYEVDRAFWSCARKEGGKATVEVLVGDGKTMTAKKKDGVSGASFSTGAWRNFLCDNKAAKVQFRVSGTGAMEQLSHTSAVIDVDPEMCPRCTYKDWETAAGVMFIKEIELVIGVDPEWFDCAKAGSTWQVRFFTGASKEELKGEVEPVYVHDLKTKAKHIRETLPYAKVCKGQKPAFWAWDVVATGEMKQVSQPRSISPARCP